MVSADFNKNENKPSLTCHFKKFSIPANWEY